MILATFHCSGFSWRDLHKFTTFSTCQHLRNICHKISSTRVVVCCKTSSLGVNRNLIETIPDCINTAVNFGSSWKTRRSYSNLGFGSAISALTNPEIYSIETILIPIRVYSDYYMIFVHNPRQAIF